MKKDKFFLNPYLQVPKGTVLVECGKMLARGRPARGKNGEVLYTVDKDGKRQIVYEPYKIKVFNTIDFAKSMHYNPFAYISEKNREKDILKFVEVLIKTLLPLSSRPAMTFG